jgi:hypothetical protein
MRTLTTAAPNAPQLDDDQRVPEELVGRLYRAGEGAVMELIDGLTSRDRANLAMFCYRKSHLRRTGLAIAATCDLSTLVLAWGTALGQAIFAQSRESSPEVDSPVAARRPKITLATHAGLAPSIPAFDEDDEGDELTDVFMVDVDADQSVAVAAAA